MNYDNFNLDFSRNRQILCVNSGKRALEKYVKMTHTALFDQIKFVSQELDTITNPELR